MINLSDCPLNGPRFRDKKSIEQYKFSFLIILSLSMTFINYLNADRAVQLDFDIYPQDGNNNKSTLNFSMIELLCNIPNCFFTPLILGYISDFISIKYLLNLTSILMLISTIMLYLYYVSGLNELYIISRIFYYISSEGLQNSTFNLIYEYSNMFQCESQYFAVHSILGYNIPRLLPYIYFLIYESSPGTKQSIQNHQAIFYSQYLIQNSISFLMMLFVSYKNKKKERNEEILDQSFLCARIVPQQKLGFIKSVKFIIVSHKHFSFQCLLGGALIGFSCLFFQSNTLIQSMVSIVNSELALEINFSTKGFTQISSIIFLFFIGKRMDNIKKKFKFYLLWYCIIGLTILIIFLNLIYFVQNRLLINIIVYLFLFGIGLQYYCSFMAINSIIYWYNQWFQRGMGYGLFSCSFNTFATISGFSSYYFVQNHPAEISAILIVLLIGLIIIYDYLQISKIKQTQENYQQIQDKISI